MDSAVFAVAVQPLELLQTTSLPCSRLENPLVQIHTLSKPGCFLPLELVHLILRIPQLGQNPSQLALVLRTRLGTADRLVQSWWSTHKYLDVFLLWARQHCLQQLLVNEPLPVRPALSRLIQGIEGPEAIRVLLFELFKFALEKNVLFSDVAEDKGDLGFFVGVVEDFADQLVHWRDSGATSNERDV